jgi:deazaflavin-dependent oxidoreductase (nitroreductase family)
MSNYHWDIGYTSMNPFVALQVFFYRLTNGTIGGTFRGAPALLLTTTGRKTGKRRTTPLLYVIDENNLAIVASNGGRPRDPSWFLNLKKNPEAEVQIKKNHIRVHAREVSPDEKARLWPLLTKMYPTYDDYQKKTTREIPVVMLQRIEA